MADTLSPRDLRCCTRSEFLSWKDGDTYFVVLDPSGEEVFRSNSKRECGQYVETIGLAGYQVKCVEDSSRCLDPDVVGAFCDEADPEKCKLLRESNLCSQPDKEA